MEEKFKSFSTFVTPLGSFSCHCDRVVEEIFQLLKSHSKFKVSKCVLGGGLPSAKNTSSRIKADADMTVYVEWDGSLNCTWVPFVKERVLDDWWRILFDKTVPDSPDEVLFRTANSLHFCYKGIMIDVLASFQFHEDPSRHRSHVLKVLRVAERLARTKYREKSMVRIIKCMGSELTEDGVQWMKSKSPFVTDIARLAKFWSRTVFYNGVGNGKSFFMELIAVNVALEEESRVCGVDPSYYRAFMRFLLKIMHIDQLKICFYDLYSEKEVPGYLLQQSPLLLNPVNPFQNLFECIDIDYIQIFTAAAEVTWRKLMSGSEDFVNIFYPQNIEKLHNMISLTSHCCAVAKFSTSARALLSVASIKFVSEWIKPVLNYSKERITSDFHKEIRYLIGRIAGLIASLQITANFAFRDFMEIIQQFVDELNNQPVNVEILPTVIYQREILQKDVILTLPSVERKSAIVMGFDVFISCNLG